MKQLEKFGWNKIQNLENRAKEGIINNSNVMIMLVALICGFLIRMMTLDFLSGDYQSFLHPWYEMMKEKGGLGALGMQIGDYNIPYQFLIALMTYLPLKDYVSFKLISIVFDLILAVFGYKIVKTLTEDKTKSVLAFAFIFNSPIVILNSSVWAQCDSIYASLLMIALFTIVAKKNPIVTFVFVGLAFCFKVQTIFILPFLGVLYFKKKNISLLHFLIIPVTMVVCTLPGVLVGRKIWEVFSIYIKQTSSYKSLTLNYPSFISIFGGKFVNHQTMSGMITYEQFKNWFIVFTLFILLIGFLYFVKQEIETPNYVLIALLSVLACVIFLPGMHERYGYVAEVFAILFVFIKRKTLYFALILNALTLIIYGMYLGWHWFEEISFQQLSIINVAVFIGYVVYAIKTIGKDENKGVYQ